jgi:uncharacterized protein (DUF58 family)
VSINHAQTGQAPVQLNLTAAGWAVVVLAVASVFIASTSRIAIGFLIPLVAAVIIDVALSWYYVTDRSLSIVPSRTVVYRPDGIPLRVTASGPDRPINVTVTFRGGVEQRFAVADEPVIINLPATRTGVVTYVRSATVCTVLGLGLARRWQTHSLPMLHWAPGPSLDRLTTPAAVDEVARLRAYVPGDRMSRVSWPITARTGQMHVRAAGDGYEEFIVVVNLGPTEGPAGEGAIIASAQAAATPLTEEALERTVTLAATLVAQLLEDGHQVRLVTTELADEAHDALRQAAIANPRLPPVIPDGSVMELGVVDSYVMDDDDLARRLARAEPAGVMTWPYGSWVDVSRLGVRTLP